jgi:hypothetical protein
MLDHKEAYFLKGNRLPIFYAMPSAVRELSLRFALCSLPYAVSSKREWAFLLFVGSNGVPEGRT